ncbi:MAG: MFS transporter [Desulfobacterales bacterium]|nr:MFS transporter [Desulfobacterales bacterium]
MKEFSGPQRGNGRVTATIGIIFAVYIAVNYGLAIDLFSMVVSDMKKDMGFDYTVVGLMSAFTRGGFLTASLISIFIIPRLGDGRTVFVSLLTCIACFWGMAATDNVWVMGSLMTLMGAAAATIYIPMVGIVGRFVDGKYHGRLLGLICGGQSVGVMGASLLVPFCVNHYSWRWAWVGVGVFGLVVALVSFCFLKPLGVFGGNGEGGGHGKAAPVETGALMTRATLLVLAIYCLSAFSCNPFQTYLSSYLRDELGFSVDMAARVWSCIALPGLGAGVVMGWLADRLSVGFSLVVAYVAIFLATLILLLWPTPVLLMPAGILFGLAFYSIFGLIPAYISKTHSPAAGVKVFALANILHGMGGMGGNFLGGWFKESMGTFQWLYGIVLGVMVVLVILALALPRESGTVTDEALDAGS